MAPVRRMVLYKHGVGFIERHLRYKGDRPIELGFKRDQMDDILKSLFVSDASEGIVTGVSYDTGEDVAQRLSEGGINVPEGVALVGLLRQLRGYRVAVRAAGREVTGTVLGTEERDRMSPEGHTVETTHKLVVRDDGGAIHPLDIDNFEDFEILSDVAQDDLGYFLDTVRSERKQDVKGVTVFLDGKDHDVRVSYISSMPSWRVSYRLAYGNEETMLQAWGIVDNNLDEDLKDIDISLVAGKPISFIYDIYTPRLVPRPVVREEFRGVEAPVELEGAMEAYDEEEMFAISEAPEMEMEMMDVGVAPMMRAAKIAAPAPAPTSAAQMRGSVDVQTSTVEMGEFFRYDVGTPITIKRGQSAMVPILQTTIRCAKEHVFNADKMDTNPVVTMRLTNDTGATLERGPVVVLDEGTYVGEAILPYTTGEAENHIAYSMDLGVVVDHDTTAGEELRLISIRDTERYYGPGYLRKEVLTWTETTYEAVNKKNEPVDLVIEHARPHDWQVDTDRTPEPDEETESGNRWRFTVRPKTTKRFVVRMHRTEMRYEEIRHLGIDVLRGYLKGKFIEKDDHKRLKEVIDLQQRQNELHEQNRKLTRTKERIYQEEDRLRKNMEAMGSANADHDLWKRTVDKLKTYEDALENIDEQVAENEAEIERLEKEINEGLGALSS